MKVREVHKRTAYTCDICEILDFDGDVLNSRLIINDEFLEYANNVFNPRNVLFISRNDGMFNNAANHSKDVIINLNTLLLLGRDHYDDDMISKIQEYKLT